MAKLRITCPQCQEAGSMQRRGRPDRPEREVLEMRGDIQRPEARRRTEPAAEYEVGPCSAS